MKSFCAGAGSEDVVFDVIKHPGDHGEHLGFVIYNKNGLFAWRLFHRAFSCRSPGAWRLNLTGIPFDCLFKTAHCSQATCLPILLHLSFARDLLFFAATTGTEGLAGAFFAVVAIFSFLSKVSFPGFTTAPPATSR
jgi:hypothetical protein